MMVVAPQWWVELVLIFRMTDKVVDALSSNGLACADAVGGLECMRLGVADVLLHIWWLVNLTGVPSFGAPGSVGRTLLCCLKPVQSSCGDMLAGFL